MKHIKNLPKKIYIQIGEDHINDFNELSRDGITWSTERIFKSDIEYILKDQKPFTCRLKERGLKTLDRCLVQCHQCKEEDRLRSIYLG